MTKHKSIRNPIQDAIFWDDTIAVADFLFLIDGKTKKTTEYTCAQGNYIYKRGFFLYVFSIYNNVATVINMKNGDSKLLPCPSNQIKATPYNGGLLYSSTYTGFHYFDTTSHPFDIPFPLVESFTIQSDTLWVLSAGVVKSLKIDLQKYKLIPLAENNIKEQVSGFSPNWILQNNGKVYCGDNKGYLKLDTRTGIPQSFSYLGNFSQGKAPVSDGLFMYFNQQNYITRLDPEKINYNITDSSVITRILPNGTIYQNKPFIIQFISNDFMIQKHSLKEIEIFRRGKLIRTLFTLDDQNGFPSGLERGDYLLRFKVNGVTIGDRKVTIKIPLTSNPVFYVCITIFAILFCGVLLKSIVNKRTYEKRILENRFQLLKQNLNPHFIFNSLNLIYSLVLQNKNQAAIKTINNFSDLHRYYLDNINCKFRSC